LPSTSRRASRAKASLTCSSGSTASIRTRSSPARSAASARSSPARRCSRLGAGRGAEADEAAPDQERLDRRDGEAVAERVEHHRGPELRERIGKRAGVADEHALGSLSAIGERHHRRTGDDRGLRPHAVAGDAELIADDEHGCAIERAGRLGPSVRGSGPSGATRPSAV
jgi:hypothetical protein